MGVAQTVSGLTGFEGRGAGTNAERRAARWLAGELQSTRREVTVETFWCRPNWALAHAWHALLGLAGSLVIVSDAKIGGAIVLVALVSVLADSLTGYSLGRRLSPERASQNVVSRAEDDDDDERIKLIVTSNYDAGRTGLVNRDGPRALAAWARRVAGDGRLTPGWIGWLVIGLAWLLVVAVLRNAGATGTPVGVAQLIPTFALVLELALLVELAGSEFGPGAGDNASGTAVALALVRALDAAPPRRLSVELVLQGAGDGSMIGLAKHLRTRRRELKPANTVVLGIAACGSGQPRWWVSDGPLVPLRYLGRLRDLAAGVAAESAPADSAPPHRGRGVTPALPARSAGLPALAIGCLDASGLTPRSHQAGDVADALDPGAMDALLEFALTLVDAIDANLVSTTPREPAHL
jgi:Peptidase family M28